MTSFDLTREAWIACATQTGTVLRLSLRDVLVRAHELCCLANESPLLDASLLRLCLAVLHHRFGPRDVRVWRELHAHGSFPEKDVDDYFDEWRSSFDLFHPETPFYQVARLSEQSANYEKGRKPAREMIAEQSSYGAPRELFESRPLDAAGTLDAATAARWLVAIQAFHPGGLLTRDTKNGDPTSVKAGPLCNLGVVTVQGDTLFHTLLLNLLKYPDNTRFPSTKDDAPAWAQKLRLTKYRKRACRGWLDWLTWQSRRIQLFANATNGVAEFIVVSGCELEAIEPPREPMCAYRRHEKIGWLPVAFSRDRALWRDSTALYQIADSEDFRPSRIVSELEQRGLTDGQELRLQIYGQLPNKASVVLTSTEVVPLPRALIEKQDLVQVIREELRRAEGVQDELRTALFVAFQKVLALGERKPDANDARRLMDASQAVPRFWVALKPVFDRFVEMLPRDSGNAVEEFRRDLRRAALDVFEEAERGAGTPSRTLKGFTIGRGLLLRGLATLAQKTAQSPEVQPLTEEAS